MRRIDLPASATPAADSGQPPPKEIGQSKQQSNLVRGGRIGWLIGSHLAHLLVEAGQHIGRMGLEALYGIRLLLLVGQRHRTPERSSQINSAIANLREERSKRWSAWKAVPVRRQLAVRAMAVLLTLLVLIIARSYFTASISRRGGSIGQLMDQARAEAIKWRPDAELVQIEISDFGFAIGPSGLPDVTKAGPPHMVQFHFLSPSTHDAIRVVAQQNLTPDQFKFMASHGKGPMWVEHLPTPYSPYTLPLPASFTDPAQAVEQAQKDIGAECAGASVEASSCSLVSGAELHMFWRGQGDAGTPVWTIRFGQNPRSLQTVTREISATSGELVALTDLQRGSISEPAQPFEHIVLANVGHDFDSLWQAVNQLMATQDTLYKPYAASFIAYLRDNRGASSAVYLSEAEFEYARITPSLYWDDRTVHVKWAASNAVVDLNVSVPSSAPQQPVPRTLDTQNLPSENTTLRKILDVFPADYAEQYTTWERGCRNILTLLPGIREWECGVLLPTTHRTDQVTIWMTRQGNPYWLAAAAPFQSEHTLVSNNVPQDSWVLWTRMKRANQWQYTIINAVTGVPATTARLCTAPPNANDTRPAVVEACKYTHCSRPPRMAL